MKRKLKLFISLVLVSATLSALIVSSISSRNAYADTDMINLDRLYKKALLNGLYMCMNGETKINKKGLAAYDVELHRHTEKKDKGSMTEVTQRIEGRHGWESIAPYPNDTPGIRIPNGLRPDNDANEVNCHDIIAGGHGIVSVFDEFGVADKKAGDSTSSTPEKRKEFFTGMGYDETSESGESVTTKNKCVKLKYRYEDYELTGGTDQKIGTIRKDTSGEGVGQAMCFEFDGDGKITGISKKSDDNYTGLFNVYFDELSKTAEDYIHGRTATVFMSVDQSSFMKDHQVSNYWDSSNANQGFVRSASRINAANSFDGLIYTAPIFDMTWSEAKEYLNTAISEINDDTQSISGTRVIGNQPPLSIAYGSDAEGHSALSFNGGDGSYHYAYVVKSLVMEELDDGENTANSNIIYELGKNKPSSNIPVDDSAGGRAVQYVAGGYAKNNTKGFQAYTETESIVLYQYYLKTVAGGKITCDGSATVGEDIKWFVTANERKDCKIEVMNSSDMFNVPTYATGGTLTNDDNKDNGDEAEVGTMEIIKRLNSLTKTSLLAVEYSDKYFGEGDGTLIDNATAGINNTNTISSTTAVREADCYTAAGSLGWVVCPIIDGLSSFVKGFYEDFVEPNLLIEPELMSPRMDAGQGKIVNSATYQAWSRIRSIANISFIIVLMIVIFSQITGIGINNYGIKKILPKLIIGVLLVNLSYIICQVAVDLSNIVGSSIEKVFDFAMSGIFTNPVEVTGGEKLVGWGLAAIVTLLAGLAVAAFVVVSGGAWAVVLMVLSGLVSVALALLALWAMLAIRKALVVILVIMSPLAFVCYMLPNTKKTFDFWFKLFKGLLVAYPVCSLLVHGGSMVGTILIHAGGKNNLGVAISAAIVSIVPIFFVPKVVTASLGALSGIVAKASGSFRKSIGGAATNRLNKGYIGARARMGKAAYERNFKRREYKAGQDVLAGYDRRRARLNDWEQNGGAIKGAIGKVGNRIGDTRLASERRRNMITEANRSVTGFQRAEEAPEIDAFNLMGIQGTKDALITELNKGENMDVIRANAAIQMLQKKGAYEELNGALAAAGGNLQMIGKRDMRRITDTLLADKKKNAAAGYYAKNLQSWRDNDFVDEDGNNTFQSFDEYLSSGGYAKDMQKAGSDIISTQDDAALAYINAHAGVGGDSAMLGHTVQQFMSASGNLDVKQLRQFNEAVGHMDDNMLSNFVGDLSTQQMSNASFETLSTIGGSAGNAIASSIANDLGGFGEAPFGAGVADPGRKAAMEQMAKNYQAAKMAEAAAGAAGRMDEAQGYRELQNAIIGAATMSLKNGGAFDGIANDKNGAFTGSMSGRMKFAMGLSDTLPPVNTGSNAPGAPAHDSTPYGPHVPPFPGGPGSGPSGGPAH